MFAAAALLTHFLSPNTFSQAVPNDHHEWKGSDFSGAKDESTTRCLFHNARGIKTGDLADSALDILTHDQKLLDADIQGVSEHLLATEKHQVEQQLHSQLRRDFPGQAVLQINSSPSIAPNSYKAGGTAIMALGNIGGRLEPASKGGDKLGRWSYLTFRRSHRGPVTFVSIYQVNKLPTNKQGLTAWHQQRLGLDQDGREHLHPRKAFIDDLILQVQSWHRDGHDIVIGGDFNETAEDPNSGILRLATQADLTEPWRLLHPSHPDFNTQESGSRRIDTLLVSRGISSSVKRIGYAPYKYVTNSDHRAMFVDFDTTLLFGDATTKPSSHQFRGVKTNDRKNVTKFVEHMYSELSQAGAFEFQERLGGDAVSAEEVEQLDALIGTCGDTSEQACTKRRPEWYSQKIAQQRISISALKSCVSIYNKGLFNVTAVRDRLERAGIPFDPPGDLASAHAQLKEANAVLVAHKQNDAQLRKDEIQAKIDLAQNTSNKSAATILKGIRKSEESCKTWAIITSMKTKLGSKTTLDRLQIPRTWPAPFTNMDHILLLDDPKKCNS
jgi:hypothetical protein